MVSYWDGAEAVGLRLKALGDASASVLLFMEYIPWSLSMWLDQQLAAGPEVMASACAMVERDLTINVPLMNSLGLLHGDAHFGNILTDGHRLYFADLGLALTDHFDLSEEELRYLNENDSLDRAYVLAKWVNWLVKAWSPAASTPQERMDLIRAVAHGRPLQQLAPGFPSHAAAIIHRHAPVASLVNDFYANLHLERRNAMYPRDGVEGLLQAATAQ